MKRIYVLIILALAISSCQVNPEKQAVLVAAEAQAVIDKAESEQARKHAADLHAVELAAAQAAALERARAEKASIYAKEWAKSASMVIGVFTLGAFSLAAVYAAAGGAFAFGKKAQLWATLVYPNQKTKMLPVQFADIGGYTFIRHLGTGAVYRGDLLKPEDRQLVAGLIAIQQAGLQVDGAIKNKKNNDVFASIQPDQIVLDRVSNVFENKEPAILEVAADE